MDTEARTGTRARTRRAILDAAVSVLVKNSAASLADIAAVAGVGRTTVHRYFPERSDLLAAIGDHILEQIAVATERARPEEGPPPEALDRICQEYFELAEGLMLAFTEPQFFDWEGWDDESESDRRLTRLIERGRADGSFDAQLSTAWIGHVIWALLYAAWQHASEDGVSKHAALDVCLRTLRKTVSP
ncbi:TetR/AcrR family transcriptional regulator [Nonomuraea antri]|uniref:TetR/AcrR family transcriptional regulator n=1 Tax=Nonomuraea antri TaxID=2730852 RepID=UPI001C2BC8D4|nr:TetR/AcrR family transcriptional regulator [Nonomuraea antri]